MKVIRVENCIINLDNVNCISRHFDYTKKYWWLSFHMRDNSQVFKFDYNSEAERDEAFDAIFAIMSDC